MVTLFNPRVKGLEKRILKYWNILKTNSTCKKLFDIWYGTYHCIQQTQKYRISFIKISLIIGTLNLDPWWGLLYRRNTITTIITTCSSSILLWCNNQVLFRVSGPNISISSLIDWCCLILNYGFFLDIYFIKLSNTRIKITHKYLHCSCSS